MNHLCHCYGLDGKEAKDWSNSRRCKDSSGSRLGFSERFQKMQSGAPQFQSNGGNGNIKTEYPYGVSPIKYNPSGSSSLGRQMWNGWRYGSNYILPNERFVYGKPDWHYYRGNYCGPCGCGPEGNVGDPNGDNPNVKYVQLDYRNLLGSGFATQSTTSQFGQIGAGGYHAGPMSPTHTCCGKDHCTTCSGVYKKRPEDDYKFKVCIGDPLQPDTMPPCPRQDLRVYVPSQMIPYKKGQSGDGDCGDGDGDDEEFQPFEVSIEGYTDGSDAHLKKEAPPHKKKPPPNNVWEQVDPCGICNACKCPENGFKEITVNLVQAQRQPGIDNHPCTDKYFVQNPPKCFPKRKPIHPTNNRKPGGCM